ncbi:uncharacterized protein LOC111270099 isoform X3 [Varroa jacobsoni]|uniref:uncharacterized protein LOC111270099 isoform X3 n=1 Tax=Varroa jacobsoni TaxID=62625 RepID=UPI000BFA2082|nr:uncharacterized protein LOC111270099 isoform X3 [Varroa jacobsoni]
MNRNCYKKFFFSFCGNGQVKTAGGVTILEKSMAVFVLIIFDACLVSSKLSEEGKVGHLEASDNQTRIRMPRQASFLCMGGNFASNILQKALDLNREAIEQAEPLLVGTFRLGALDLKDGRLYGAYTTNVLAKVEVYCSEKTIYLWTPLSIRAPQVLFDLVYLASIAAGEFLVYFDWLFLNITLAVPRPPKEPGAKSKTSLGYPLLRDTSGIAVRHAI